MGLIARLVVFIAVVSCSLHAKNNEDVLRHKTIVLGASNAQSGPAKQLGVKLNTGSQIYFDRINKSGGIAGIKIELIALDDGYEPFKAVANTQELLRKKQLFSFFNYVGTPTSHAAFPIVENSNLPFLTPFTGADFLHAADANRVFNLRASYFQESYAQVEYLVSDQKITKVGILIQADEFGLAVQKGYEKTLKAFGLSPVVVTRYRRNTDDIDLALELLIKHKVEAVAFVGTYLPMAELINKADTLGFKPYFTTVSFISSQDLFSRIESKDAKVLVTEVVPNPQTCELALCRQFTKDMKSAGHDYFDHVQFEGYLNAYAFVEALKQCESAITRSCILKELQNFSLKAVDANIERITTERVRLVNANSLDNAWSLVTGSNDTNSNNPPPVFLHFYQQEKF